MTAGRALDGDRPRIEMLVPRPTGVLIKTPVFTLKWGGRDLNPRPEDYESPALTG
jgi:hypothetical protein